MKFRETKQLRELLKLVGQGKLDSDVIILFLQLIPDIAATRYDAPGKAENMPLVAQKKKYAMRSRKSKQLDKLLKSVDEGQAGSEVVAHFLRMIPDVAIAESDNKKAMTRDRRDWMKIEIGGQVALNPDKKSTNKIHALQSDVGGICNIVSDDAANLRTKRVGEGQGVRRPGSKREDEPYIVPRRKLRHTARFKNKQTSVDTQTSTDPNSLPKSSPDTSAELPSTPDALPKFSLRGTARSKGPRSMKEDNTSSSKSNPDAYSEPTEPLVPPPKRVLRPTRQRRAPEETTNDVSAPAWARNPEVTFYDYRMDTADVVKKMATENSPFPRGATKPNVTTDDRNEDVADVVEKLANSDKTNKSLAVTRPTIDSAAVEDICPHLFDCPCDLIKVCSVKDCDGQCGEIHGKPCREFLKGKCQKAVPCEWGTHDPANREKWQAITDFERMLGHD